jgi:hypothetical protein
MSENSIVHFETLYEQAEQLAKQRNENKSTADIVKEISELLTSYSETDAIDSKEITKSLKNRYLGEVMFLITALSQRDDVNVYGALQQQLTLNKIS